MSTEVSIENTTKKTHINLLGGDGFGTYLSVKLNSQCGHTQLKPHRKNGKVLPVDGRDPQQPLGISIKPRKITG